MGVSLSRYCKGQGKSGGGSLREFWGRYWVEVVLSVVPAGTGRESEKCPPDLEGVAGVEGEEGEAENEVVA